MRELRSWGKQLWKVAGHIHLAVWIFSGVVGIATGLWALVTGYGPLGFVLALFAAVGVLVLIKLILGFLGSRDWLSMSKAACHVYDEIYETEIGLFVQRNFDGDKSLEVLARYIADTSIPLFGKRPSGASLVTIDKDIFKHGEFHAAGDEYRLAGNKTPEFTDISIKRGDLKKAISAIEALSKTMPQKGGYI